MKKGDDKVKLTSTTTPWQSMMCENKKQNILRFFSFFFSFFVFLLCQSLLCLTPKFIYDFIFHAFIGRY